MHLKQYLKQLPRERRLIFLQQLAERTRTTTGTIQNVVYGSRGASAALAMQAELLSGGAVSRSEMRPEDAALIWADLSALDAEGRPLLDVSAPTNPPTEAVNA